MEKISTKAFGQVVYVAKENDERNASEIERRVKIKFDTGAAMILPVSMFENTDLADWKPPA